MRCYDACDMIWIEFFSQTLASYVMLRVHRVEVIFWWFNPFSATGDRSIRASALIAPHARSTHLTTVFLTGTGPRYH